MSTDTLERREAATVPPRGRRWGMILAIVLLGALALTVTGMFPAKQLVAQRHQVAAAREHLDALVVQNAALEQEIAELQTDEELERLAREEYGYVMPGETGYVVVVPPGSGAATSPAESTAEEPTVTLPWWERIWRFVTGGDVGDG